MSYCRFSEGDAYIYGCGDGWEVILRGGHTTHVATLRKLREHVIDLIDREYRIPDSVLERIDFEIANKLHGS